MWTSPVARFSSALPLALGVSLGAGCSLILRLVYDEARYTQAEQGITSDEHGDVGQLSELGAPVGVINTIPATADGCGPTLLQFEYAAPTCTLPAALRGMLAADRCRWLVVQLYCAEIVDAVVLHDSVEGP